MKGFARFRIHPLALPSLIFLIFMSLCALFSDVLSTHEISTQNLMSRLVSPSNEHYFGTDGLGRDLFSRTLYGAKISLMVGLSTAFFSLLLGTAVGLIAGYFGGMVDQVLMRTVDLFYTLPTLLLAILFTLIFGRGFTGIFVAIALFSWMTPARIVRGQVLSLKELPYIEAARSLGLNSREIILKHILPNLWGTLLVSLGFQIPANIMAESMLSFLGLGLQPPFASWGTLSNEGLKALQTDPHLILFPGTLLFLTLVSFQFFSDGLKLWLTPGKDIRGVGAD